MKILCVNGMARSGKDTFCKIAFHNRGMVYSFSTIDEVKQIAMNLGWDGKKDEKGRKFLSDLKDCLTEYNDLPSQSVLKQIERQLSIIDDEYYDAVIFLVQMREPEEIKRWKYNYNAKALLVSRPGIKEHWGNHADDNVFDGEYDYVLVNDSDLDKWQKQTIDFIDMIREENWESNI